MTDSVLSKAIRLHGLIRAGRCAEDTLLDFDPGQRGETSVLEVAERLADELANDLERLEREQWSAASAAAEQGKEVSA